MPSTAITMCQADEQSDMRTCCEFSTGPGTNASKNVGRASEKSGLFLVKLIDHSGKLPSGPVTKKSQIRSLAYMYLPKRFRCQ